MSRIYIEQKRPSAGNFNFSSDLALYKKLKVNIYTMGGEMLRSNELTEEDHSIDLSELTTGFYYYRLLTLMPERVLDQDKLIILS